MDRRLKNEVCPCDLLSLELKRIKIFDPIPSNKHQNATTVIRQAEMLDRWTDTWANTFVICSSILNWMWKPDYGGMWCLQVGFLNIPYLIKENKSLWPLPLTLIWYIRIQQDVLDFSALNRDALTTPELSQTFSVFLEKENAFINWWKTLQQDDFWISCLLFTKLLNFSNRSVRCFCALR